METSAPKSTIEQTLRTVRSISFEEKRNQIFDDDKINAFLDQILDLKNILVEKADLISGITEKINALTWLSNLSEEDLMKVNDIISAAKDLHSSLTRQYLRLGYLREKGIAPKEIEDYKDAVEDLRESYSDLESVFFFLPEIEGFVETTKEISLL